MSEQVETVSPAELAALRQLAQAAREVWLRARLNQDTDVFEVRSDEMYDLRDALNVLFYMPKQQKTAQPS